MEVLSKNIDDIKASKRTRRDMGDIEGLRHSIEANGLLHPVTIDKKGKLVAGARRLEACRLLGWDTIPCAVVDNAHDAIKALQLEATENACRKEFTPEEAVRLGERLEELEKPKATARRRATQNNKPAGCSVNLTEQEKGETAEIVAKAVGMSRATYNRAKRVVRAASENPDNSVIQKAVKKMNAGGGVSSADRVVTRELGDTPDPPSDLKKTVSIRRDVIESLMESVEAAFKLLDKPSLQISTADVRRQVKELRKSISRLYSRYEGKK